MTKRATSTITTLTDHSSCSLPYSFGIRCHSVVLVIMSQKDTEKTPAMRQRAKVRVRRTSNFAISNGNKTDELTTPPPLRPGALASAAASFMTPVGTPAVPRKRILPEESSVDVSSVVRKKRGRPSMQNGKRVARRRSLALCCSR